MELESLKYAWKTLDTLAAGRKRQPDPLEQERQLLALLRRKSRGPVATIRRNLLLELTGMVGLYTPVIAYYLFHFGGRLSVISWFLLAMAVLFGTYYYRMNRILLAMQCPAFQMRPNLERQVQSLERYIRNDGIMSMLLIPLTACLLGALFYWKLPAPVHTGFLHAGARNPLWRVIVIWVCGLSAITVVLYRVNKWYLGRLYGRHIEKLRELVREINKP
ncbi:MAG: hypothetical protein P4L51_11320 [Puia sp.]|nr:hypothetical protein [Puia sp.]